jgi:tetratricopeptide (TPR) repeat protein
MGAFVFFPDGRSQPSPERALSAKRPSRTAAHTSATLIPMLRPIAAALVVANLSLVAQVREPLGQISFPNSGAPSAQAEFIRGVAWLHSFGYEDAIDRFRAAQKIDPGFVMAYWGEAMCFNQPLWFGEEPDKGRAALLKLGPTAAARAARATTPRERMYLAAVEALWGPGTTAARQKAYADAMAALVAKFPGDDEAQAFYALSLLGILPRGDQAVPLRQKAGAIVEALFARNPRHPGAAHYIIHAYDHAQLAPRALAAARAYAKIAPAASHALHMPAHTFVQLGLWDEAAATDQASWDASIEWANRRKLSTAARDYHSLSWLQYEWTQQGRFTRAREAIQMIEQAMNVVGATGQVGGHHYADSEIGRGSGVVALRNDRGSMRARFVVESERWTEMKGQASFDNVDELFALGLSAYKLKDDTRLFAAVGEFEKLVKAPPSAEVREQAEVMLHELGALLMLSQGDAREAFAAMERATAAQARMPKPIGRPYPVKGADELYAEILLMAGRSKEAVVWFERTLSRTPNRSRAVLGLARAAAKAGDTVKSRAAYKQFLANWRTADPNLPELTEARAALKR